MDNLINVIGSQIRILRKSKNLIQEELAFKAGFHPTYIGQIKRGENNLTISSLNMITQAFDITLEDFFLLLILRKIRVILKVMYHYLIKILLGYFKKLV